MVLPDSNLLTIANPKVWTPLYNFSTFKYTFPSIWPDTKSLTSINEHWGKNQALKILQKRVIILCMSHKACLARRESLYKARSLKPIPPTNLDLVNFNHLIQWIFLLSPRYPQKNFLIIASLSWQSTNGSLKQPMAYVGMAWAIVLIKTSLLA